MVLEVTGEDNIKEVMESVNIELAQISEDEPESTISKHTLKVPWNMSAFRKTKPNLLATNIWHLLTMRRSFWLRYRSHKAAKIVKDNNEKYLLKEEIKELNRKIATYNRRTKWWRTGESEGTLS